MGDAYAIVGKPNASANNVEFDRPTGTNDQTYSTYDGSGGVSVGSYWRRVLYAAYFRETNFLLSSVFNSNSKLLYIRDPETRVQKIAPFLTLDSDPYPAVVNGKILWIIDGYTTASTYPYSQQLDWRSAIRDSVTQDTTFPEQQQTVNYVRNSVKATVDAYTGEVNLYSVDDQDPVLKTWNKAFGGKLIKPQSAMPSGLVDHLRYPEDQFKVQRDLLSRFHVTSASDFFTGNDFWQVPNDPANGTLDQPPYYLVAALPGQATAQFQLTAAMSPRSRGNLSALMSASYQGGKPSFTILRLPSDTALLGPNQAHGQMTSIPQARTDLTQFNSSTSELLYGNLLSLPVANGMLYVEPLYLRTKTSDTAPFLRKVLVAYGAKYAAYADNISDGLQQLVEQASGQVAPPVTGGTSPPGGTTTPPSGQLATALQAISQAITDLSTAQKSGDPEAYGKALKALQAAVQHYQDLTKNTPATPSPSTTPTPSGTSAPSSTPSATPSG
jgi:uncharacterized membrane protein (UPF0182 family)